MWVVQITRGKTLDEGNIREGTLNPNSRNNCIGLIFCISIFVDACLMPENLFA